MGVNNLANEGKRLADQKARDQQLDAVAAQGEPEITPFVLERARRKYFQQFEIIALIRDGRARKELSIDGRIAEVRRLVEATEPDRLEYEHLRSLFEAQAREKAARSADALARTNKRLAIQQTIFAAVVMVAVVAQAVFAWLALRK